MNDNTKEKSSVKYSEGHLMNKIKKFAKVAGKSVIYAVLLLYYVIKKPATPFKIKATIIGSLGYFISPIDIVPDFLPLMGYTDDLGVLITAIAAASFYIDDQVKINARMKLREWFSDYNDSELIEIEEKIKPK